MVSYSPQSRRLAVGARNGQLALYDLRSSRCQVKRAGERGKDFLFNYRPKGNILLYILKTINIP